MNSSGIIELTAAGTAAETADRVEALLHARGIKLFGRIDQAAEARTVGLSLRPTILLLFGDPKAGTPLMQRYPSLALDLPLKALVWESDDGITRISFNASSFLQQRYGMAAPPFPALTTLLEQATSPTGACKPAANPDANEPR